MTSTTPKPTLCFAGGGTGGHLYTGIALAESWTKAESGTGLSTDDVHFIGGTYGLESTLLSRYPFAYTLLPVSPFGGKSLFKKVRSLFRLLHSYCKAVSLLKRLRPRLVIGIGGYASVPALLAAWRLRIPRALVDQNAIPGRANRLLGRIATVIFIHFKETRKYFPAEKIVQRGNPVRPSFREEVNKEKGGVDNTHLTLLVLGGSQGARAINTLLMSWTSCVPLDSPLRQHLSIVHQTGATDLERVQTHYRDLAWPAGLTAEAFLDPIVPFYLKANLVIARSGAGTVCELAACGRAAILIPYPYAADNHQEANARALEELGGARVLLEKEATPQKLTAILSATLSHPETLGEMGEKARLLDFPHAAKEIWSHCLPFLY